MTKTFSYDDELNDEDFQATHRIPRSKEPLTYTRTITALEQIAKDCRRIAKQVAKGEDMFHGNSEESEETRDLCERYTERIGEASNRLHSDYKMHFPQINWSGVYGIRSKITHGYDGVKYGLLWDFVSIQVPEIAETLKLSSSPDDYGMPEDLSGRWAKGEAPADGLQL